MHRLARWGYCMCAKPLQAAAQHVMLLQHGPFQMRVHSLAQLVFQEVEITIVSVADDIVLERPFTAQVKLQSHVDRQLGPLTLATASGECSCSGAVLVGLTHNA